MGKHTAVNEFLYMDIGVGLIIIQIIAAVSVGIHCIKGWLWSWSSVQHDVKLKRDSCISLQFGLFYMTAIWSADFM